MKLHEEDRREKDMFYRIRWDHLRFEVSPSALASVARGNDCPQKEMAREIIKIMYDEFYTDGREGVYNEPPCLNPIPISKIRKGYNKLNSKSRRI